MNLRWLGMALAAAFAWAAGCGGNVVVDDEGAGGSGAASTGPGTTNTTTSTNTGDDPLVTCAELDKYSIDHGCNWAGGDYLSYCINLYAVAPACTSQLDAFMQCMLASDPGCDFIAPECDPYFIGYSSCSADYPVCSDVECFNSSDGSCGCKGACDGQEREVTCGPPSSGIMVCSCMADGQLLGTCEELDDACSPDLGCCSPYFY